MGATLMLRQLFTGSIDFLLYSASSQKLTKSPGNSIIEHLRSQIVFKEKFVPDTDDLFKKAMAQIQGIEVQDGSNTLGQIKHIMKGYQSQYYSYQWSKVYSCDLFSEFEKQGLLNKDIGMRYRKIILAPGGSVESEKSLE